MGRSEVLSRTEVVRSCLTALGELYLTWQEGESDEELATSYRARCATIGRRVRVELVRGPPMEGIATGVDAGGRLVVRTGSRVQVVGAGDVYTCGVSSLELWRSPRSCLGRMSVSPSTRTHPKRLILPAVTLVVLGVVLGFGVALIPDGARPIGQLASRVGRPGAGHLAGCASFPTLVDHHLHRHEPAPHHALGNPQQDRQGHPVDADNRRPVRAQSDRRMLGCGTLFIQAAAGGTIKLDDVPHVEQLHIWN